MRGRSAVVRIVASVGVGLFLSACAATIDPSVPVQGALLDGVGIAPAPVIHPATDARSAADLTARMASHLSRPAEKPATTTDEPGSAQMGYFTYLQHTGQVALIPEGAHHGRGCSWMAPY